MHHQSSGETVSQTVRNLLAIAVSEDREALAAGHTVNALYSQKLRELADHLGVTHAYMPRKLKDGTWDMRDLDKLAEYFGTWPVEFVPGPHDEKTE